MQKQVDVDPWDVVPSEDLVVDRVPVRVRGLTIRELRDVTRTLKGDGEAIAEALVIACVTRNDGKDVNLAKMSPNVFRTLSEAVARVNGFISGNSNATGDDDSSFA